MVSSQALGMQHPLNTWHLQKLKFSFRLSRRQSVYTLKELDKCYITDKCKF
jgi:hypothetical protein